MYDSLYIFHLFLKINLFKILFILLILFPDYQSKNILMGHLESVQDHKEEEKYMLFNRALAVFGKYLSSIFFHVLIFLYVVEILEHG